MVISKRRYFCIYWLTMLVVGTVLIMAIPIANNYMYHFPMVNEICKTILMYESLLFVVALLATVICNKGLKNYISKQIILHYVESNLISIGAYIKKKGNYAVLPKIRIKNGTIIISLGNLRIRTIIERYLNSFSTALPERYIVEDYYITTNNAEVRIVYNDIKNYKCEEYNVSDYVSMVKDKIRSAFDYRQQTILMNPNRNLLVVALQGPPRVGKSLFCKMWSDIHNKSYYISSNSNDFCQDLKGQDTLILDDYNWHNMPLEDLLKLLDPHSMSTIKSRFKNKLFIGDTIMITTNTPINEWYRNEDLVLRDALYKRISAILDFGPLQEDGTVQYTVNRIIYNDSMRNSNENPMQLQQIEAVKTFDLKKYINIQSDQKKIDEFVQGLDDM